MKKFKMSGTTVGGKKVMPSPSSLYTLKKGSRFIERAVSQAGTIISNRLAKLKSEYEQESGSPSAQPEI